MGQLKTLEEREQFYDELMAAWRSLYSSNCKTFASVPGKADDFYNCIRKMLEKIERFAVQKYGDFSELKIFMMGIFADKKVYDNLKYRYGVTFGLLMICLRNMTNYEA